MFKFPDNCVTSEEWEHFCLRWQERMHELSPGFITDDERVALVAMVRPFLLKARKDAKTANYAEGQAPLYLGEKKDWDGEKIIRHPNFNLNDKGAVLRHAHRVWFLNRTSPDINKISNEVANAKFECLYDPFWDKDITDILIEVLSNG